MEDNNKMRYEDLLNRYSEQRMRLSEVEELLEQLQHKIRPSLVRKRKKLEKVEKELNEELDFYEDFVTDATTFDRKTVIEFMVKFYSFYFKMELIPVKIYDKSFNRYAQKAYILVSQSDYDTISEMFDLKRTVYSRDVLKECKDEFIYLNGNSKTTFMYGFKFNKDYKQFSEIEEVIERCISYKMHNKKASNKACLMKAFEDYVNKYTGVPTIEDDLKLDSETKAIIRDTVDSIKREQEQSDISVSDVGDKNDEDMGLSHRILSIIDDVIPFDESSVEVKDTDVKEDCSTLEETKPFKVINEEPAPEEKRKKYQATSEVLLSIINNLVEFENNSYTKKI